MAPTWSDPPRFKLRPLPPSPGPLYPHRAAASGNPGLAASQWPRAGRPLCPRDNQWRGGAGPAARVGGAGEAPPPLKETEWRWRWGCLRHVARVWGLPWPRHRRLVLGVGLCGVTGWRGPARSHSTYFPGVLYLQVPLRHRASPVYSDRSRAAALAAKLSFHNGVNWLSVQSASGAAWWRLCCGFGMRGYYTALARTRGCSGASNNARIISSRFRRWGSDNNYTRALIFIFPLS